MEYRSLGGTGLKVSRLGFGIMTFNTRDQAIDLLERAREYGCNFFDGAEAYGDPRGNAEKLFGEAYEILKAKDAIKWRRSDLVITTKIYATQYNGENELGVSRKHIMEGINAALKRTKLDYFDIVYAHRNDPITPLLETVSAFTDIIKSGKAFYWGTSMWPLHRIIEAYWIAKINNLIPPIVEQCQYSMFERQYMEKMYLPIFNQRYQYATTIWGALDSGILTGKYLQGIPENTRMHKNDRMSSFYGKIPQWKHDKVRKLKDFAENELKTSITKLSLAWVLKNDNTTVIILGARNAKQLNNTFECFEIVKKLDDNAMKQIEEILQNKPIIDEKVYGSFGRFKRNFKKISKL